MRDAKDHAFVDRGENRLRKKGHCEWRDAEKGRVSQKTTSDNQKERKSLLGAGKVTCARFS